MLKKWTLGIILLSTSLFSQAAVIYQTDITGADMAGIEVTVNFASGGSETQLWSVISTALGTTGNTIIDHEGFSGGVTGTGWSLTQSGFTLGEVDAGTFYGLWDFQNADDNVTSFVIDTNDTGVVFDTDFIALGGVDTNGSAQGRAFDTAASATGLYSDPVFEELYNILTIDLAVAGTDFTFMADTDLATEVPEPSTLFTFALGLIAFTSLRKKSLGK